MSTDESTDLNLDIASHLDIPAHMVELAQKVNRLGEALHTRRVDPTLAAQISASLTELTDQIEPVAQISKIENLGRRNRIQTFIETGSWPGPPADGSQLEFDPASVVGGELNPFTIGARYYRDGDEAVGRVNVGRCFEGPPERVHGGVICAIFDEVMGCVFRATGTPSAFTGELAVRFTAPCPVDEDLEFRARIVETSGRRNMLEGHATGPDGEFATATATFIEMRPEHFAQL